MKQLLKGGIVVSGTGRARMDVLIDDGKIAEVSPDILCEAAEVVDVTGKFLFPGFIDGHTHFDLEVSGTVTADNFETGTKAAVSGGTTMILDFATQNKGETLTEALENWHKKADGNCSCDYGFHMAISDWNEAVSKELEVLVDGGITSFKLYMTYDAMVLDDREIFQVLRRLKEVGGITGVHCENMGIIKALVEEEKASGHLTPASHPVTRPAAAEAEAVSRLLKIAEIVDTPVIIVHLSSGVGYQEVKYARERGQEIFLETCPQYLLMDSGKYSLQEEEARKYVISPPLRTIQAQTRLWNALKKDHIHTVATDHCSFTTLQKAAGKGDFTKIPNGMPGVETRPVLMYTYGVLERGLTLEQMCRLLSENAAKLYGLYPKKGCIAEGSDADIVVWNPDAEWILTDDNQHGNADYCPYHGCKVRGIAEKVYLRGELVSENGSVLKERKGTYIPRKKRIPFD